jgi:LysR family transcriptional regulator, cyn operon transcriptional activator
VSIELRHLRTFIAVAETQNFTRAAKQLSVAQSGISQQIKELESGLKASLFERVGTRVRLTRAGQAFREQAAVVLRRFSEACASVDNVEELVVGHLDVGVIPALNVPWIPPVLARFAAEYPGVAISIHEKPTNEVETEVEAGRFDLGIGLYSGSTPGVRHERLCTESLVLLVQTAHPLARRRIVALGELENTRIALMPENYPMRELVEEAFRRAKVRPRIGFEIDTIEALLGITVHSGMPTILPAVVLDRRTGLGLRAVPLAGSTPRIEFGLMWPGQGKPDAATRIFVEILREVAVGRKSKTGRSAQSTAG